MLDMATELRELRGLPEAMKNQFDEQQAKSVGKEKEEAKPLLTMSQWKVLLESNKKASSLPPTPAKAGIFTAACEKVKAAPNQILQLTSAATAALTNTAQSVSTTCTEVIAALKSNLTIANNYNNLSLSSGYTVPVEVEQVIKQAGLNCVQCVEKYFDDIKKQGLPIRTAMMAEFSIRS